jgi:hypothetical protein
MGRKLTQDEQPDDPSRRRFLALGGLLTGAAVAERAFGPASGIVFGQTSEPDWYDIKTRFRSLPIERQMHHIKKIEYLVRNNTWWGRQMNRIISSVPESCLKISSPRKSETTGSGTYDYMKKNIEIKLSSPDYSLEYLFSRGFSDSLEMESHECTHYKIHSNATRTKVSIVPISEMHANMIFGIDTQCLEDKHERQQWKEDILKASIRETYTKEKHPEVLEIFLRFGIYDIIDNHFDDLVSLYSVLLKRSEIMRAMNDEEHKENSDFSEAHITASEIIGAASDRFDRKRRFYPKLKESVSREIDWAATNSYRLEQLEEECIQKMILDRIKSYAEARKITKNYATSSI